MSDKSNARMLDLYMEEAEAPLFLSGMFQSPPRNFFSTEKVEIDVIRDEEDVAIVIKDLATGAHMNESSKYVNKSFTPPIFKEAAAINAFDMIKRQAGQTPFEDPNFALNATTQAFAVFRKLERKIRRSIELMCSQVLQTGTVTLTDAAGVDLYTLDFGSKTSHMATVGTAWATNGSTGTPLADLEALASVVRRDGKKNPNKLTFGASAWSRFLANADVQKRLLTNLNSMGMGQLAPVSRGQGATFQGFIILGNYRFEMWTYDGWYKHPVTGVLTPYLSDDNVVMTSDGRLDLAYGAIPRIVGPDARALPFLPSRMSSPGGGLDLSINAWVTSDGESLMVSAGTRPLVIPTAIDTFARLDVTP